MKITFQTPPKILDEKIIYNVLRDYKILNCEVLVRDEYGMKWPLIWLLFSLLILDFPLATIDDFIDVIMKDHRKYIPW